MFIEINFEQLINYCDIKYILPQSQAGLSRGYSTVDNIFCSHSLVKNS